MDAASLLARSLPSLVVIVGALLVLRHWARRGGPTRTPVRVVGRAGLAKGAVVALVEVEGQRLLVGASDHGVSLLTSVDRLTEVGAEDATEPATTRPATGPEAAAVPSTPSTLSTTDRPRMALVDHLRHLTVRQAVPRHPRRPSGVPPRT